MDTQRIWYIEARWFERHKAAIWHLVFVVIASILIGHVIVEGPIRLLLVLGGAVVIATVLVPEVGLLVMDWHGWKIKRF